ISNSSRAAGWKSKVRARWRHIFSSAEHANLVVLAPVDELMRALATLDAKKDSSMNRRGIVWLALSFAALPAPPILSALAQSGIIRVIIGTVPGGAIDPYARMIAEHMSRTLGQPIIVENKPGASGTLAAEYVANAPADGTILWLGTQAFTEINPNALATTGPTRDRSMPQVPTFAELGYPDFTAKVWFGLLVKEGVPEDVFKRLTEAAKAAHADPAVKAKLEAQGFEVSGETGPQ